MSFQEKDPSIFSKGKTLSRARAGFVCLAGLAVIVLALETAALTHKGAEAGEEAARRVILLADDSWGANWNIEDEKSSLSELFLSYGWRLDLASVKGEIAACEFARKATGTANLETDLLVSEIGSVADYDAVIILPGQSHENLIADRKTLDLVREADRRGVVVAGFCRGVRLLAAAGVVRGRRITGHPDYAAEYEAAGARYHGFKDLETKSDAPPPVIDGNLVTVVRSKFFREEAGEAIRAAVERTANKRENRQDPFGCTVVMTAKDGHVLVGNNEDRNHPRTIVTFIPAKEPSYGRIVFGYDDAPTQGGMNDQGLFIDGNALASTGWRPDPDKPAYRGNLMMEILATCATCEDVEKFFGKSNFPVLERARFPLGNFEEAVVMDLAEELKKGQRRIELASFFKPKQEVPEKP